MFEYCYFFNYLLSSQGVYADIFRMGSIAFKYNFQLNCYQWYFSMKCNCNTSKSFFVQWLIYINVEIKLIAVQFTIYFPSYALQLVLITVIQYVYLKRILTYNKNNLFVKAMPWARKQCKYFFVAWHVARGIHFTCNISWKDR